MAGPRLKVDRNELRSVERTGGLRTASISHFVGFSGYGWLNSTNARAANNVGTAAHNVCRGA
jgi:hypothetical protein